MEHEHGAYRRVAARSDLVEASPLASRAVAVVELGDHDGQECDEQAQRRHLIDQDARDSNTLSVGRGVASAVFGAAGGVFAIKHGCLGISL